jgi:hypothetical protein
MPLFDRDHPLADIPADAIDSANLVYERLKSRKVTEIVLAEPETGLIVPNQVRTYLQAHLRRCLTFVEAGAAEINADRPLAAELCSRALYENVATICDFADRIKPLCEAIDYKGLQEHVSNAAFITRIPAFLAVHGNEVYAPQILDLIDAMKKRYPEYRNAYDHLSDIVHPNGLGAVVYFTKVEPGISRFVDDAITPDRALGSLICATLLLLFVELAFTQTEERLIKLTADVVARREVTPPDT